MNPGIHPYPFASIKRRLHAKTPKPVASQTERSVSKQHLTRQSFQPEGSRGPSMRNGSCCPFRKPALFSVGLFAFALAMIPAQAYAGWVVEGEPAVLVGYGERYVSELGPQATHHGVDCLASAGAQCLFPAGGTVSFVGPVPAGDAPGCGTTLAVSVRIEDGRILTLMPFDDVAVAEGQRVAEGQAVGTVASSGDGSTTVSHVHVGLKRGRTYYDPSELLGVAPSPSSGERLNDQAENPVVIAADEKAPLRKEPAAEEQVSAEATSSSTAAVWQGQASGEALLSQGASNATGQVEERSVVLQEEKHLQEIPSAETDVASISSGARDSAYEAWLSASADSPEEAAQSKEGIWGDIKALISSTGIPPHGVALLLASCLGAMALLVLAYCRKESDQVVDNKMLHRRVYTDDCKRKASCGRRLSTFGGLMAARQGK